MQRKLCGTVAGPTALANIIHHDMLAWSPAAPDRRQQCRYKRYHRRLPTMKSTTKPFSSSVAYEGHVTYHGIDITPVCWIEHVFTSCHRQLKMASFPEQAYSATINDDLCPLVVLGKYAASGRWSGCAVVIDHCFIEREAPGRPFCRISNQQFITYGRYPGRQSQCRNTFNVACIVAFRRFPASR